MNKGMIKTVNGWINQDDITGCYVHEHLFTRATPLVVADNPNMAVDDISKIQTDLEVFAALGGNCIVDVTTMDYGRDIGQLQELSRNSKVHIVATGGFNKGKFNRAFLEGKLVEDVADMIYEEVMVPDGGPGVLKIGTSLNEIHPWEYIGLKAISQVHIETGIPITTHTEKGTFAQEQLNLFKKHGIQAKDIILGHLDQNPDFDLHVELIKQGAFLGYDSIPKVKYNTKDRAIEFIVALAKMDLHTHILLSGDFARKDYYLGFGGSPGLGYLLSTFKDELSGILIKEGLNSKQIISDLFIHNPAKALSFRK